MGAQPSHSKNFDDLNIAQKSELTLKALSVFVERIEEQKEPESSQKHSGIFCDYCKVQDFENYRYKCMTCQDYDLCSTCFEEGRTSRHHLPGHPVVRFSEPGVIFGRSFLQREITLINFEKEFSGTVHEELVCNVCGQNPIRGLSFSCYICKNYNQCSRCFKQKRYGNGHQTDHPMVVLGEFSAKFASNLW